MLLESCGGRTMGTGPVALHAGTTVPAGMLLKPKSVSPALVAAPPMAKTPVRPASAMTSLRRPKSDVTPLGFTQIPGGAVFVTASPDGSMWVLSTQGGSDGKDIYHYVNGTWTNIPGAATRLAVAPDNSLWAVNLSGGIYHYQNGVWSTIAGGASDISIGADGSVYVLSSIAGNQYGEGIWHYVDGTWTQLQGAGVRIAASWDAGTYNNVAPGGFYVVNAQQSIFYYNPQSGFAAIPGGAVGLAPTVYGGLFVLGVPSAQNGNPVYYNNLATGAWTQQPGTGVSIATNSSSVYLVDATGNIYQAPLNSTGPLPWTATQHQNFVAIAYGTSSPYHVGIFSPGQSTASATIDYTGCCIWQIAFDPKGNLVLATTNNGIVVYAPGNTGTATTTLSGQGGFSLATDPQGDYAIGGYNAGPNVVVYLGGVATSTVTVPGAPAFHGLALSPSGELATAAANGSVMTYPRSSTTSNRTIAVNLNGGSGTNSAILAYDGQGNLAVGSSLNKTIGIYAPGATAASYSITLSNAPNALAFDGWNRLLVASGTSVTTYAAGSTTIARTFTSQTNSANALGIGPQGDVGVAGNSTASMVYQANGNIVTINGLASAESIAVSP